MLEFNAALELTTNEWNNHYRAVSLLDITRCAIAPFCKYGVPGIVASREYIAKVLAEELLELRDYLPEQTKRDLLNKLNETRS